MATAEIDQDQRRVAGIGAELRRQRPPHVINRRKRGNNQRHRRGDCLVLPLLTPGRAHRQRILADRNADAERRAQFHADCAHRIEQCRVLARLTAGGHPVGRQLDVGDVAYRRRGDVGNGFANRHPARSRRVDDSQRRALAHRHRLSQIAFVAHDRDRAVRDRHLPRPDHLIAHRQSAHGAIADRDQERLVGHRRQAQHALAGIGQRNAAQIDRRKILAHMSHIAMHLRRLAEQHVHRHVDRRVAVLRVDHLQLPLLGRRADHREQTTFALAQFAKQRQALRRNAEHITLLRFIAPDLHRCQPAFFQRHLAQIEHGAASGIVCDFRESIGQTARADIMDRQDRVVFPHRPAGVDHFLRAPLHFGIAALHRVEIQIGGVRTGGHRRRRAAAHADAHAGAAQLDQQAARGQFLFLCLQRRNVA